MPHIHELIDLTVSAYIIYDNKVLLAHHKKYDKWLQIGGHVELNQDSDQALLNEIREETELEVEVLAERPDFTSPGFMPLYTPFSVNIHWVNETHRHLDLVYFVHTKSDQFKLSDEHYELRWFSLEELEDPKYQIQPSIKYYAREAIKAASES